MLAGPSQCSPRSSPRLRQASSREMSADWLGPEAENYSHSREGGSHAGARHSGSMPTNGRLAAAAPTEAAAILVFVALTVLELTLKTRLASKSEICLPLLPNCLELVCPYT